MDSNATKSLSFIQNLFWNKQVKLKPYNNQNRRRRLTDAGFKVDFYKVYGKSDEHSGYIVIPPAAHASMT